MTARRMVAPKAALPVLMASAVVLAIAGIGVALSEGRAASRPTDSAAAIATQSATSTPSNEPSSSPSPTASVTAIAGVSDSTIATLVQSGTTFAPVAANSKLTSVTLGQAVAAADGGFNFTRGKMPSEVSLGYLTVSHLGALANPDSTDTTLKSLDIDKRLVWLVVLPDVAQPVGGPQMDGDQSKKLPTSFRAPMWEAIDALTGQPIYGESM